jgi:hypothetical protein
MSDESGRKETGGNEVRCPIFRCRICRNVLPPEEAQFGVIVCWKCSLAISSERDGYRDKEDWWETMNLEESE